MLFVYILGMYNGCKNRGVGCEIMSPGNSEFIHIGMANMTAPVWNWTRTSMDMKMWMDKAHEESILQKELQVIEKLSEWESWSSPMEEHDNFLSSSERVALKADIQVMYLGIYVYAITIN